MRTFNFTATKTISLSHLGQSLEAIMNPENTSVSTLSINFRFGTPKKDWVVGVLPCGNGASYLEGLGIAVG